MRALKYVSILCLVFFAGCESKPVTNADIAGNWKGPDGAVLHFESDGKFSASKLSRYYVTWPNRKGMVQAGAGLWNIRVQSSSLHGGPELELIFERSAEFPDGAYSATLYVSGSGPSRTLYFWREGEPYYEFTKVPPS